MPMVHGQWLEAQQRAWFFLPGVRASFCAKHEQGVYSYAISSGQGGKTTMYASTIHKVEYIARAGILGGAHQEGPSSIEINLNFVLGPNRNPNPS